MRRTPPETRQRIVALYQAGKKWQEIAAETGVSSFTVGNVLRAEGVAADRGQLTRTSPEDEAKILTLYAGGVPLTEIVRETGRTEHTITAVLRRNGSAPSRKPHRLSDDLRERIPDLYASGMDAPEIGRLLGCHSSSVYNVLEGLGVDRREQIACDNPGYFDRIDTPDKAYWLGFLGADGCVTGFTRGTKTYLRLQVKLARKDRDHLVTLHTALKARRPIRDFDQESFGKVTPVSMLAVSSQQVADALISHGIIRKKTDVLQPWDGPADLMPHYWRGLVDGDGHITINERGIFTGLVGSRPVTDAYAAWVNSNFGTHVNATVKQPSSGNTWVVQVGGRHAPRLLLAALYDDAPVALARKKALADLAVHGKPLQASLF
jgi:DNA invertase Pin-like site-specific DNA recombinase